MSEYFNILMLEDSYPDAESIRITLEEAGMKFRLKTICYKKDYINSIDNEDYDVVLSDHKLPDYDGISALKYLREVKPQTPFIFVSGTITEKDAIDAIRYGAQDYVFKQNLNKLVPAVQRVLHERELLKLRIKTEAELQISEEKLRKTNERFNRIVKELNDIVWTASLETGEIIDINDVFEDIYGLPAEKLKQDPKLWKQMVHPEDKHIAEASNKELFEKGKSEAEYRILKNDGTVCWILDRKSLLLDENGKAFLMGGIAKDITQLKKVQHEIELYRNNLEDLVKLRTRELAAANQSLQEKIAKEKEVENILKLSLKKEKELSEMKSRFISNTSHEFRTPLTTIQSSAQLIQKYRAKWTDDRINDQFSKIKYSISVLTEMLDDILTISHADSGKIAFNPQVMDFYKFCRDLIDEVKPLAKETHNFIFHYLVQHKIISLDPKLMRLILINILSNAIKYSPDGGDIILEIAFENKFLKVSVVDQGIGIPEADLKFLYEPFFRAGNAGDIEGTGLGLSIVQRSVDMHKGRLECCSELNKGTSFIIILPAEYNVVSGIVTPAEIIK